MDDPQALAKRFEAQRPQLHATAYRVLGSHAEADDAVQEAWLRLSRHGGHGVDNLGGWLTTVVTRVSLDALRSRRTRREAVLDPPADVLDRADAGHPEREAELADDVTGALLVVLDSLTPAERVALVLHDVFGVPFDEVAEVLGRSLVATRQLASRARRRVRAAEAAGRTDDAEHRRVVEAFLAASRAGDLAGLVSLLDPDAVVRADAAAVAAGAAAEVYGATAVAGTFAGRARAARLALVDGLPGAVWSQGGRPRVAFGFTVEAGRVVEIELIADPAQLDRLDLTPGE